MKLTTIVGGLIGAVVGSALGLVAARLVGGFADIVDRSYVPGFVVFSLIFIPTGLVGGAIYGSRMVARLASRKDRASP